MPLKNKISHYVFLALCLSILAIKVNWFFKVKDQPTFGVLNWDMFGYYLYLPSAFIYGDVGLTKEDWLNKLYQKYEPSSYPYHYANGVDGKKVNIYSMGMAVVYAPGFFLARVTCMAFGFENDGYSKPFEFFTVLTSFFVFVLNIYLLRKVLLHFFEDRMAAFILLVTVAGTNYFYQSGIDSVMVHNYIVTLTSAIILLTIRWHQSFSIKTALLLACCMGLAALIRPPAVLLFLIPLLWNVYSFSSFKQKVALIINYNRQVILMIIVILLIGLPQLIYFKYTSGNWLSFNRGETLDWFHPHLAQFLFSYKKGWLLYTPIMIFALLGFFFLYKKQRPLFTIALLVTIIQVWMLASWDAWWFHTSYGQRGMVDIYALLSIPLGFFIQNMLTSIPIAKIIFAFVFSFLVYVSLFQTWQYLNKVLHWERTTKTSYWKVFLKTKKPENIQKFYEVDRNAVNDSLFLKNTVSEYKIISTKKINLKEGQEGTALINGQLLYAFDNQREFAPHVEFEWKKLSEADHVLIRANAEVIQQDTLAEPALMLAAKTESDGKFMGDQVIRISAADSLINKINSVTLNYITPLLRRQNDKVTIFTWNYGKKKYLLKSLTVRVYEPINSY